MAIYSWTKEPVLGTSKRATFGAFLHYESSSQTRNRSCCQQCDACMFWFRKVSTKKKKALTKQKNKLKMQKFVHFFCLVCQATRLFLAIHGHLVDGQVRPPAEGAAQRQTRCLQRQHLVDAKSMDGWDGMMLSKVREVHGSPIVRSV